MYAPQRNNTQNFVVMKENYYVSAQILLQRTMSLAFSIMMILSFVVMMKQRTHAREHTVQCPASRFMCSKRIMKSILSD